MRSVLWPPEMLFVTIDSTPAYRARSLKVRRIPTGREALVHAGEFTDLAAAPSLARPLHRPAPCPELLNSEVRPQLPWP